MVQARMPQKIAKLIFALFLTFVIILPSCEFLYLILGFPWQDSGLHYELSVIIPLLKSNSSFHFIATCQEWPKLA